MFYFFYLVDTKILETYKNNIILCENYNNNCNFVLKIYGTQKCNLFLKFLDISIQIKNTPTKITKKHIQLFLLFENGMCDSIQLVTNVKNYIVYKYTIVNLKQDIDRLVTENLNTKLEFYYLFNSFNLKKTDNLIKKIGYHRYRDTLNDASTILFSCHIIIYCLFINMCLYIHII